MPCTFLTNCAKFQLISRTKNNLLSATASIRPSLTDVLLWRTAFRPFSSRGTSSKDTDVLWPHCPPTSMFMTWIYNIWVSDHHLILRHVLKEHFPQTFYFPSLILSIPRISPFPFGWIQGPLFVICFLDPSLTFDIFSMLSAWPLASLGCRCPRFFSYRFFMLPEHYMHLHHFPSFHVCYSFGTTGRHTF